MACVWAARRLLFVASVALSAAHEVLDSLPQEVDLPAVTFRDLQQPSSFGRALARHALAELGALEVTDVPSYPAARRAALEGAARCLGPAGAQEGPPGGLERRLPGGALRRSLAARTSASGVLGPLDQEGRVDSRPGCGGSWRGDADHLRLLVRAAALQALAVLHEGSGDVERAVGRAEVLEHFHLYLPNAEDINSSEVASGGNAPVVAEALPLHVDAGLIIAATPGLELDFLVEKPEHRSKAPQAGPLILQRPGGDLVRPRLRPDAVLLLAGRSLATVAGASARAMPHALRLRGSLARSWYGAMLLPPNLLANASGPATEALACSGGGVSADGFGHPQDLFGTCSEGTQWCWMQCMPVPASCAAAGETPQCLDVGTGEPWEGGDVSCPNCAISCMAEEAAQPFCRGPGTDMYMGGFKWSMISDTDCLVFLFPSLVLDTQEKFLVAVALTFLLAFLGPESLRLLQTVVASESAGDSASAAKGERKRWSIWRHLAVTAVSCLCVLHGYIVHLLSMSFSLEIFGVLVLGLALGRCATTNHEQRWQATTLCCQMDETLTGTHRPPGAARTAAGATPASQQAVPAASGPEAGRRNRAELTIGGMSCSSCTGTVERCLRGMDGVDSAEVVLLQERATVIFDPSKVSVLQLCQAIESIGFDAVLLQEAACTPRLMEGTAEPLRINGKAVPPGVLHLEGCANLDAARAAGGPGLLDVQLLPTGPGRPAALLRLLYDPQEVGARTLLRRLRDAGCDVQPTKSPPPLGGLADGVHAEQHELQIGLAFRSAWLPSVLAGLVMGVVMSPPKFSPGHANAFGNALLVGIAIVATWSSFASRAGRYFLENASKALQHGSFTMDVLIAASTSVTAVYGVALAALCLGSRPGRALAELRISAAHFLAMAPILLLVVLGGKKLELRARQRTAAALKELLAAQPSTALVRFPDGFREVPLELLELGDLCRVSAGARFPAEGIVVEGAGAADESLVTGESAPVEKTPGERPASSSSVCLAGSTLAYGDVVIRVTAVGPATTLGRLADLVARAQGSKPRAQRFADALAGKFVPSVLVLTAFTFLAWLWLLFSGEVGNTNVRPALKVCTALQFALSVMMLACPCAMGLATPTAISVAVGVASSRHHCLVRDAAVLEAGSRQSRKTAIILDKTGTITEGKPRVVAAVLLGSPGAGMDCLPPRLPRPGALQAEWLSVAMPGRATTLWVALGASEAAGPRHPVAAALEAWCESQAPGGRGGAEVAPGNLQHVPGKGIRAEVQVDGASSIRLQAGGPSMLPELEREYPEVEWRRLREWAAQHKHATLVFVAAAGGAVAAALALEDPVRQEAPAAAAALRRAYGAGCDLWVCTGDNGSAAAVAAAALGIPSTQVRHGQLPEDKRALVQSLQAAGAAVVMVGDGLNDAPALAQADLGVAIGAGAQLACDAADVVLCRSSLLDLLAFRELCLATRATIFRNFAWAFGFNILGLPVAAGVGFPWGITISPMVAGMAMAVSSVLVVSSSLMLQRFRPSLSEAWAQAQALAQPSAGKARSVQTRVADGDSLVQPFLPDGGA